MTSNLNKILLISLSTICILIFFIPYSSTYIVGDNDRRSMWSNTYLIDDPILLSFYLPFTIVWFSFLFVRKKFAGKIFNIGLWILSLVTFLPFIFSMLFVAQDFEPMIGIIISGLIFPLFSLFTFNNNHLKLKRRNDS